MATEQRRGLRVYQGYASPRQPSPADSQELASRMELTDLELVERVQSGDAEAYGRLVHRYQDRIYTHVCRLTGGGEDAADLTQEIFVKVYQSLNQFRGQASFQTWLYRVAGNLCIDRHRRQKRAPQVSRSLDTPVDTGEGETELHLPDWGDNPERAMLSTELQQRVQECVLRLSEKLRPVLVMHDLEGQSYEEIAAALRIPLGTVKSRLFLARAAMREMLLPYLSV